MKKYLIVLAIPALFACGGSGDKKNTPLEDSLTSANLDIKNDLRSKEDLLQSKEEAVADFLNAFNEIQWNLNEIKAKEKIISESSVAKELKKTKKDQIITDIQAIYDLLDINKKRVATLNKKLNQSNLQIGEIELAVVNLTNQLESKEGEIADLKNRLESLNVDFATLKARYVEEQLLSDLKTEKLNTAYYVVGLKKDLVKKGIITKKGGFIGIGKVAEMNADQNSDNYFTKIDLTQTTEIPIHGDKIELVSTHPADSYKLVEGANSIDKIVILDQEKFWSVSKYLIISRGK